LIGKGSDYASETKMRSTYVIFFSVLINKACFGDRRLITERGGVGVHSDLLQATSLKENQQLL
jgi:hypothetical protein